MNTPITKSTFAKFLAVGAVVAACVGGAALPAQAATVESDAGTYTHSGGVNLHSQGGIQLGHGDIIAKSEMEVVLEEDDHGTPTRMFGKWKDVNGEGSASYPIMENGKETGDWVSATIDSGRRASATCVVSKGKPNPPLATPTKDYQCSVKERGLDNDWDLTVTTPGN
jgi:hypothetical protein